MIYLKEKPVTVVISLLLILSSCSKHTSEDTEYSSAKLVSFLNSSEIAQSSLLSEHEKKGLNHLLEDDLARASLEFNRALASKPKDPLPHFLNALTYHLISKQGDAKKADLAEIGYTLAIKRDPSHAYSYYYRGILMLEKKKYQEAQNDFASAILNKPNQPKFFHGLAVSSYYAHDITTAAGAIDKALSLDPKNPEFLHTAAIIMAAGGEFKKAEIYQKKLKGFEKHQRKANFVANRIGDWQSFHKHLKLASEEDTGMASGGFKALKEEIKSPESADEKSTEKTLDQIDDRMVIVDVVLILTQEENTDTYGLNLLEKLTLNYSLHHKFGSGFNTNFSSDNGGFSTAGAKNSNFQYFLHSITIPEVSYSINAATAQGTRSEILARPSLLARHGESSHFFSGDNILFGFGTNNNIDFKEKEVGIFLVVTPHILDDGRVNIKLDVKRSFFVPQNANVKEGSVAGFQTSTTRLISDVVLEAGDTLVLGGLSDRVHNSDRSGTQVLGDIPILDFFFSKRSETKSYKSVIILVTPRLPHYTYRTSNSLKREATRGRTSLELAAMNEVRGRYTDWFNMYSNLGTVFDKLQGNALYRELRTGDVSLEKWQSKHNILPQVEAVLESVY
ncbi:MAG: hypothetical protein C0582_03805 [Alphaproteobacteria bacterium]|nr:MAG: hypothetical protein C0582_03805 [Alphaproteobacteria bacterium]